MKANNPMKKILIVTTLLLFLISGCGTTTGNGRITVESSSFTTAGVLGLVDSMASTVTDFKVCVKKIQLKNDLDEVQKKDGVEDIDFPAGLIDLSSGAGASWGSVEVPVNFTLKRIKIHIHKDQDLCGVDYSVKYNSFSTNKNLVIKHVFDPVIVIKVGDTIELNFQTLVTSLRSAADDGSLNNGSLKDKIEEIESSVRRK